MKLQLEKMSNKELQHAEDIINEIQAKRAAREKDPINADRL